MILIHLLVGLIMIAVGAVLVRFARDLLQWFGASELAERYLGSGGTQNMWRLFGVILILGGILYALGLVTAFLRLIVSFIGKVLGG